MINLSSNKKFCWNSVYTIYIYKFLHVTSIGTFNSDLLRGGVGGGGGWGGGGGGGGFRNFTNSGVGWVCEMLRFRGHFLSTNNHKYLGGWG